MFSLVSVPLYDTLGAEACSYIINQSMSHGCLLEDETRVLGRHAGNEAKENVLRSRLFVPFAAQMTTVLVDTPEKAQLLLDSMEKTPCLKRIVVFDPLSNNNMETAQRHGVQVLSLTQLQDEGRQNMKDPVVSLAESKQGSVFPTLSNFHHILRKAVHALLFLCELLCSLRNPTV